MSEKPKREQKLQKTAARVGDSIKDLVARGNERRIVIKSQEGKTIVEASVTVVAVVLFILLMLPGTILIGGLLLLLGIVTKVRIEVQRIINDNDSVIEMKIGDD